MDVREKLVEFLNGIIDGGFKWHSYSYESGEQLNNDEIASHLISHGVTVQGWIPVTERLPENDAMVIGYTPCDGFMFVGYYHEENKYDWRQWYIVTAMRSTKVITKKVTHWMPLPEPPKGE